VEDDFLEVGKHERLGFGAVGVDFVARFEQVEREVELLRGDFLDPAGEEFRVAPGVEFVVTPASREVGTRLREDGSLRKLEAMGAIVTTPGCGACCGTSGVIPGDGMNVISTANRNFRARMGNATASIYLASPAACAAAAVTGRITDPR
jgi:homoaconitase/3-isopropylmalate dehydratase large subunit